MSPEISRQASGCSARRLSSWSRQPLIDGVGLQGQVEDEPIVHKVVAQGVDPT